MTHVLYLSYDGMTDPLGQSQVLPYLMGLSKAGYRITLLSFEKPDRYAAHKALIQSICDTHHIDWRPELYTKTPPVFSTLKDIHRMKSVAQKLHAEKQFKVVHCRSYIAALAGMVLKKKFGVKFIFDMRGFWADERVDGNLWPQSKFLYRRMYQYFKKKEIEFLNAADAIISLTHNAEKEMQTWEKLSNRPVPVQVIPCCVDTEFFDPKTISQTQKIKQKQRLKIGDGTKVLTYVGSIGTWYLLEEMLQFYKTWAEKFIDTVFLIVTPDEEKSILEKAKSLGIDSGQIRIAKGQRSEMPLYISLSDCAVFFIKPAYSKKASSPTKQGEIMAMGIPVVCNSDIGDTDFVIKKYNSGYLINAFNETAYRQVLEEIDEVTDERLQKIRAGANDFYALDKGVELYRQVYENVLSR